VQIIQCKGYELEKERPNTSEDFFNRSEVHFVENGEERTFHLLYVRYFDEIFSQFTPFSEDPIFNVGGRDVYFKDIVALVCLLKNPGFRNRKRSYINSEKEMAAYFNDVDFDKLPQIFQGIENGGFELKSSIEFIKQPQ
jgi:hypothetical protein